MLWQELERERSKLEKDKARFLEEAVRRDSKSFVFSCPPATPTPATPAIGDRRYYFLHTDVMPLARSF